MDLDYIQSECLKWIRENKFTRIIIQFKREELEHSVKVVDHIKDRIFELESRKLDIYVTQSNTCCVDLLVTQHVSHIDAIIHLGKVCLSKPHVQCDEINKPILFVFGRPKLKNFQFEANVRSILDSVRSIADTKSNICILYDTNLICYAKSLEEFISNSDLKNDIEVANLYCPTGNWDTTQDFICKFSKSDPNRPHKFGFFALRKPIEDYECAIYLGSGVSVKLGLMGPRELWKIPCSGVGDFTGEKVNLTKLLSRRMAVVGRLKDEEELKIGVVITNPLPQIGDYIDQLETYANARRHTLFFISMVQVTDEYKMGNFDLCDAFVIINSCHCCSLLASLVFNRPILTDLEFKLACGFEAEYGRVLWPGSTSNLTEDDIVNKRRVSEVSLALAHTRNQLLERCSQARSNKWSGLDYGPTSNSGLSIGDGESLDIEEGLCGIASSYASEPMKRISEG